ncbi:interferon-induced very large GTPase 1-like [Dendronephthya gigantea]|uniref:interferon-induced very large GTPase 1-like n=1 Tax=Dendronephthya gigantea TaxID=151771 RepID=UPI00106BF84E|nr:interferon-induced very large GTPase 1-like [Dendronephthya gigantea]XP_028412838.1 interferon-induced very large GTPase 1-like [Dendronephthya gigantea]
MEVPGKRNQHKIEDEQKSGQVGREDAGTISVEGRHSNFVESNNSKMNSAEREQKKISDDNDPDNEQPVNLRGKRFPDSIRESNKPELRGQSSDALLSPSAISPYTNAQDEISQNRNTQLKPFHNFDLKPKYTLKTTRKVDNRTLMDDELTNHDQIPDYILRTLMIANYHAREFTVTSSKDKTKYSYESDESDSEDEDDEHEDMDVGEVNPMDALIGVFHCSDEFLRQDLAKKLSACQLSVPFLLPNPEAPSEDVTVLFSALENVTKAWKGTFDDNDGAQQVFAIEHPFPIVSFIRIGEPNKSKSSLINKIMSDGSKDHDIFFHKNMKGGNVKRKIVDGLVELGWFLPGGNEKQTLQKEICFANLRGDAMEFRKQRDFLSTISSVLCILLPSNYPDDATKILLGKAALNEAKVIFIFNEKPSTDADNYFKELRRAHRGKLSLITETKKSNEYDFLKSIRVNIQKTIEEVTPIPIVERATCALECGIRSDEDQPYIRFETCVDSWLEMEVQEAKKLLTLQTHVPILADLEREKFCPKHKSSKSKSQCTKRDVDEIYRDITEEREAQKESFQRLDERVLHYLNCVAVMGESQRNKSLNKLKHQLDKMSLKVMTQLHQKYCEASLELQKKRKKTPLTADTQLPEYEHLKHLEKSIANSSFGLEHIIRELAQLYQLPDIPTNDYAGAAADILLSGQPLELLDGDSSYIPLKWFNAVYSKLEQKTNNAKLYVISVLGIQSSGKSTMLNTMFGLEFAVSAGRCTRGAFASLIPVGDSLKTVSKFDYVLIIDTEGLRGSGNPKLREHDNELATFAIGVADVTIVNIFGENHNEMKEFLEIAVHAFLKMKLVKERKKCKIVHQNVAATDAKEKLTIDRSNLKEDLDKMTRVAAMQENCEEEFQKLDDIMSFDENEDVFYIPSLLQGNPPMAPVNPNYGRGVEKIKQNIITLMSSKDCFQLSVSQFRERVCNLWNAILKENFIFNFRNVIEVRAYASLDRKFFEESVNLMATGMTDLERKIEVALRRCTTKDERKEVWNGYRTHIGKEAAALGQKMETAMDVFFETSEDKVTLEQWRGNIMKKIIQMQDNQSMEVTNNCLAAYNYWQNRQDVDEKKQSYQNELLQKAKKLITSAQNTGDTEKFLAAFEHEWNQWMVDVPLCQEKKTNVDGNMLEVLRETNRALNAEMTGKLEKHGYSILNFKVVSPQIDLKQLSIKWYNKLYNFVVQQKQEVLSEAKKISDEATGKALDFARKTSQSGVRCNNNDLAQMYHMAITTLDKESERYSFKFCDSLKCDILLYTFAQAFDIFDEMETRYLNERNIREDLEKNLRPMLKTYFKNLCEKMGREVLAATSFADVLQKPIESELNRIMGPAVAKEVMANQTEFQSKGQFHASVLIQLGKEGKFEAYIPYLEDPFSFLKTKMQESVENYCLNKTPNPTIKILIKTVKFIKKKIFAAISIASNETKTADEKLTFWVGQFVKECSTLAITKEMFAVAAIDDDLKDIDVFEAKVCKSVKQFLESLIKCGVNRSTMSKWNPTPCDHLLNASMFGCQSFCPFCKGLCDNTVPNHPGSHSTKIHRPIGLTGYSDIDTEILEISICTNNVANETMFRNRDTCGEWHYYKDYQSVNDYYKSWSIPPDPSFEASEYWQWFVAKFWKDLAAYYNVKEPEVPSSWKNRSFKEVERKLRQEYNMVKKVSFENPLQCDK